MIYSISIVDVSMAMKFMEFMCNVCLEKQLHQQIKLSCFSAFKQQKQQQQKINKYDNDAIDQIADPFNGWTYFFKCDWINWNRKIQ